MSFRCQVCKVAFPNKERPGEYSPNRIVTKTLKNQGGPGFQILEERNCCFACAHDPLRFLREVSAQLESPDGLPWGDRRGA